MGSRIKSPPATVCSPPVRLAIWLPSHWNTGLREAEPSQHLWEKQAHRESAKGRGSSTSSYHANGPLDQGRGSEGGQACSFPKSKFLGSGEKQAGPGQLWFWQRKVVTLKARGNPSAAALHCSLPIGTLRCKSSDQTSFCMFQKALELSSTFSVLRLLQTRISINPN